MLYTSVQSKLIIGSPDGMTIGEAIVPDALHEPAKSGSPTPSTRPNDPNLIYIQPRKLASMYHRAQPPSPARERYIEIPCEPLAVPDLVVTASVCTPARCPTVHE